MKIRVIESNLTLEETHENQAAAVGGVLKRAGHRSPVAGGVENGGRQIASSDAGQRLQHIHAGSIDRVGNAKPAAAKLETLSINIQDDDLGSGLDRELHYSKANRPSPDHQHKFSFFQAGPVDRVASDRQRFHQRQLIQGQVG